MYEINAQINLRVKILDRESLLDILRVDEPRLVMISGRTAMGKTAFAVSLLNECRKKETGVLMFSLETGWRDMQLYRFDRIGIKVSEDHITVEYDKALSPEELDEKVSACKGKGDLKLIIIDRLQLLRFGWKISHLRDIVRRHNCFVLVLSTVPNDVELKEDMRPTLEDIGHAGFDDVCFLYRDAYYEKFGWTFDDWEEYINNRNEYGEQADAIEEAELIVAKSKVLSPGTIPLLFDTEKLIFMPCKD